MTSGNGIYGRECKKKQKKQKHGLVNTNLLSVLFIDTIIHMLQDLLQYECSVVYRGGNTKPMLEQCGYSVAKNSCSTGVHPNCWMGLLPRSLLYHLLSCMSVFERLCHKKGSIVVEMIEWEITESCR